MHGFSGWSFVVVAALSVLPTRPTQAQDGGPAGAPAPEGAAARRLVRLGADAWCPYNCDPASDAPGYVVEIARAVFARHGWETRYEKLPWSRAIADAQHGDLDGIIAALHEDAPGFVFPERSIGHSVNVFYVRTGDDWRYAGIPSLVGVAIGAIRDYSYGAELDAFLRDPARGAAVELVSGDDPLEQNVAKLLAGRVRILIENGDVMQHFLHASKRGATVAAAGREGRDPLYVAFSPSPRVADSAELAQAFDAGIDALRASGELARILARYGVADWEPALP